jgi:adenosylcobinamide-phosphate synthase
VLTLSRPLVSAAGLALGYGADRLFGDPRRFHPVAGFGRLATAVERLTYGDRRCNGVLHTVALVGGTVVLGLALERLGHRHPALDLLTTGAATWAVLGGRSLQREALIVEQQLSEDDLAAARLRIRNLVGRDPTGLNEAEIARACVESVAENTSDAVIAPLCWGAVAGVPGLLGYRAVNTLDAMVGHRSLRYGKFGWASARLDDAANWLPARLAALLTVACAPVVAGSSGSAWRATWHDARHHPSPNAGVVEAAFAGALGVRLGGRNIYSGQVEDRGTLGDGREVRTSDISRATTVSLLISGAAAVLVVTVRARSGWRG